MKVINIVAVSALALFAALPAAAADLISQPPPVVVASATDWSGVYIGGHVGYGFTGVNGHEDGYDYYADSYYLGDVGYDLSGFLAGGQIGARQQSGNFVLGVQGDISWSGQKGIYHYDYKYEDDYYDISGTDSYDTFAIDWQGSLTGRAGVVVDQALIYGLGGVTIAGGTLKYVDCDDMCGGSYKSTLFGVTLGVGAELKVTDNVSVFGEYAYTQFADFDLNGGAGTGDFYRSIMGAHSHAVKVGVNLNF
jgi:outer membrane immunogenic protein